MERNKIALVS